MPSLFTSYVKKYNPQTLIGHSIGGAAICYYLHKNPTSSIQKVVFLGAPSSFKKISDNFIQTLSLRPKYSIAFRTVLPREKFNIDIDDFSGS